MSAMAARRLMEGTSEKKRQPSFLCSSVVLDLAPTQNVPRSYPGEQRLECGMLEMACCCSGPNAGAACLRGRQSSDILITCMLLL